jgi:hypothetical protein
MKTGNKLIEILLLLECISKANPHEKSIRYHHTSTPLALRQTSSHRGSRC